MNKNDVVAIIVLNYNKKKDILECLDSIFNLDYNEFEVIVVDNGSSDGSAEEIKTKYPNVHLIESKKNLGASGGRNLGIKYATENFDYKFLFFLDNDITIKENALSEMANSFCSKENIGIVSPKCYVKNAPGIIKYAGGISVNFFTGQIYDIGGGEKDEGQFEIPMFRMSCGGLFLVGKSVIDKIGNFDENFNPYGWEDIDFSIRVRKSGYKIFYNPKAVIFHKGGKIGRGKAIDEYEYSKVKNYFYLFRKHANFFQLLVIGLILPFKILIIAVKEILKGDFGIVFSQVRGFFSLFKFKTE